MDTPSTPVTDPRGGRFFVFREGAAPIHEDDLTDAQRTTLGLNTQSEGPPHITAPPTEEVGPDV